MIVLFALIAAAEPAAPPAVRAFIERRTGCNHWAGEEPYDDARRQEIERAVRGLRCDALEADEAALLRRHARQPAILRLIARARDADGAL